VLIAAAAASGCAASPPTGAADTAALPAVGELPGADAFARDLADRLAAALAGKGAGYVPRTRHRREDGSPRYTNRLILETSPYLLQHAHNPVSWYPWGDEAFEAARRLGRPVLLSIGYSTCHWCHVMEEESFEDEEIAEFLNRNYVAIKVDREERPDVDAIYMSAVQMLTGRGGWPMTTWLTHDREVYFGGTYFPPRDGARGASVGFLTLLRQLREEFDRKPEEVAARGREITERLRAAIGPEAGEAASAEASLDAAIGVYRRGFDGVHGGLRQAPKFPSSLPVRLLLWRHRRTGDPELLEMARLTLRKMAAGGIYDHVGGGFHRYSTDGRWLVPHFEKMLYDNALLAVAYLETCQLTGDEEFARTAREVLDYVGREMTSPEGGFYSATDADSLGPDGRREEGLFFTWSQAEIRAALGEARARRFEAYYGVTDGGNFEGRSILHVERALPELATLLGVPRARLADELAGARAELYRLRLSRPPPLRDEKILAAWNGLMISAMARGAFVLEDPRFADRARRAADFVLTAMRREGRLLRSYKDGSARHTAYLDDYAFVIAGLLDLYETTAELRWLREAVEIQAQLDRHYRDGAGGGYFMTADDHEALLAREKPAYDGAEPSGNSVALMNLLRLGGLTSDDRYRAAADGLRRGFGGTLSRRPTALPEMLLALEFALDGPREVVVVTGDDRSAAAPFLDAVRRTFVPGKVVAVLSESELATEEVQRLVPIARDKVARNGGATAYVCRRGVCQLPASSPETLVRQLQAGPSGATPARSE